MAPTPAGLSLLLPPALEEVARFDLQHLAERLELIRFQAPETPGAGEVIGGAHADPAARTGGERIGGEPAIAALLAERLRELDAKRRGLVFHGTALNQVRLGPYAAEHLVKKAKTGKLTRVGSGSASFT